MLEKSLDLCQYLVATHFIHSLKICHYKHSLCNDISVVEMTLFFDAELLKKPLPEHTLLQMQNISIISAQSAPD